MQDDILAIDFGTSNSAAAVIENGRIRRLPIEEGAETLPTAVFFPRRGAMRIGTAAGALMYAFMYAASLPLENNPVVDDHLVGVIVMAVLALGAADTTWGLGHWWNRMDVVEKNPVLR